MLDTPFQSTRPARGATTSFVILLIVAQPFQSTRPARGATVSTAAIVS